MRRSADETNRAATGLVLRLPGAAARLGSSAHELRLER